MSLAGKGYVQWQCNSFANALFYSQMCWSWKLSHWDAAAVQNSTGSEAEQEELHCCPVIAIEGCCILVIIIQERDWGNRISCTRHIFQKPMVQAFQSEIHSVHLRGNEGHLLAWSDLDHISKDHQNSQQKVFSAWFCLYQNSNITAVTRVFYKLPYWGKGKKSSKSISNSS